MTSRVEAVTAAAQPLAAATRLLFDLPPAEAARLAFTPGGPSLQELERRIALRTGRGNPAAA